MKRTFLVTVEGIEGDHAGTIQSYVEDAFPRCCVNVTDITATHAKERQLLDECLLLARFDANGRGYDTRTSFSRVCIVARELRALMEGKG